jgi:hypothetical protein
MLALRILASCGADPAFEPGPSLCDGRFQQLDGDWLDARFDADGDGHFDARDPGCVAAYGWNRLDCDDLDAAVSPDATELACNGVDDDCISDTPNKVDGDGDGSPDCEDCDDRDPNRSPLFWDLCWDGVDSDCDGVVDEGCPPFRGGTYTLDQRVHYGCGNEYTDGDVDAFSADFDEVVFLHTQGHLHSFVTLEPGDPFNADMVARNDGTFEFEQVLWFDEIQCQRRVQFFGEFLGEDDMEGIFRIEYTGYGCGTCLVYLWDLDGTRVD